MVCMAILWKPGVTHVSRYDLDHYNFHEYPGIEARLVSMATESRVI